YDKHKFLIHDYFFAKSLDKLRPGGVMALITSKGTMDKKNPSVRKYIAQRAELLGAIRLPNNTFKGNAGTEVVSDILILQKRDRIIDVEPDWVHLGKDQNGITMNSYFVDHPEMILGEMKMVQGRFKEEATCEPYEGAELENQLAKAVANIQGNIPKYELSEEITEENDKSIPADPTVRNYSYTVVDGEIYFRENSIMKPADVSATAENRIKGMIGIRDCVRRLVELQTEDYADETIKSEQSRLNTLYDDFVKKYGYINSRANNSAFAEDSSYPLLSSLEVFDDEGNFKAKADIFTKRTIKQKVSVSSVDTPSEALAISLAEKARIDMEYMSELTGKTESEIVNTLKGVVFLNPLYDEEKENGEKYLPADEYLSGNVREKLEIARLRAKSGPSDFTVNVEALEKVQPTPLSASEISVRLGSTWVPAKDVAEFMFDLLNTPRYMQWNIKVHFSEYTGEWNIEGKSVDNLNLNAASTYGTKRINAYKIIEETLNLRDVRVFDTIENPDGKTERVLNKRETAIAQGKQEAIKAAFSEWIWKDPQRRERLCKLYNEKFNSIRPREYDGSHLNFVGINPEIQLKQHQVNAVAHILYGGNTLLAHVVGAGKTFEMVAAAQESKRLGLCRKSLIVVPNHLTEQWAAEYMQLYPAANILVARKKDFETKNRKRFCARIATGDYDAVIIGHSQLEKIPLSAELQIEMLNQQMDEIIEGISELKRNRGDSFSIKQLEKTKKTIKQKLDKLNDQSKKDDVVTFEELGVDRLFVDEAHYYKNLAVFTKMRNVGGISQTEAMKSSDLYMKCRYLDKLTGGRGVVFATGTPISNSMVEMYTMQKYLQSDTLRRNNLINFDAWASTFGETVTAMELAPEGNGYRMKTRFARFYNLPELMAMFKETADIQTADMLKLPVPKAEFHNVLLKPSEEQKAMVESLSDRAERVRNKMVAPNEDNMLLITNDGRKLALDQRLVNEMLPGSETGKTAACAENVFKIWQDTAESRSTQMVFCDLSTPHGDGKFNVYDDLKKQLVDRGIPPEEIAFIHSAKTEVAKKEMFGKVRSGKIRVLIGSTQKMGAGTNVQQKLKALHHLDCPWRPSDLQQREGRIIRRGNENSKVDIYTYVTENTFDSYLYQLVESKQKFIGQIMTSKSPVRSAEDIDETALSYAEIKALCSGNPHIKEKMDLDIQVQKLKMLKSNFLSEKYNLEDRIAKYYPQALIRSESIIEGLKLDIQRASQHPLPADKEQFIGMIINGVKFTDKKAAGAELIACCKKMQSPDPVPIGEYRGFAMNLYFDSFERQYAVNLKGERGYSVTLGTDVFGNISRINNAIDGIERQLERAKLEYESLQNQLQTAKEQVVKPFPQEEELQAKTARLNELNALITLDNKKGNVKEADVQNTPQHSAPKRRR
ncbi:MAG: SNF2-related protein, partial [Acutalibacteraceae bacterium]